MGAGAGTALAGWSSCRRALCSAAFSRLGMGIAIRIPAAAFEHKRACGNKLAHRMTAVRASAQGCLGDRLLHFKDLVALLAFVLVDGHGSTPLENQRKRKIFIIRQNIKKLLNLSTLIRKKPGAHCVNRIACVVLLCLHAVIVHPGKRSRHPGKSDHRNKQKQAVFDLLNACPRLQCPSCMGVH